MNDLQFLINLSLLFQESAVMLRITRSLVRARMVRPVRHYTLHTQDRVPAMTSSYSIEYQTARTDSTPTDVQALPKYFLDGMPTLGPVRAVFHKFIHNMNGELLYELKRYNEAISCYKKSLGSKHDKTTMYQIACCYGIQNDTSNALEWFLKAKSNGWHDWKHAIVDKDLDCICDKPEFVEAIKSMKNKKSESEIIDEYMKKHEI